MSRELKFFQAINEAIDLSMARDARVYIMGLGVPDPKGVFGSTVGLQEKYGPQRVMDMPCSENGMTGVAIGSALVGMRPIMTHQRIDFALLALEQLVNQAANWHYMFDGNACVPLVIRMIVGRGWGQGPQHSQSVQAWFAHVPGLKVVMPATAYDAKGLLISSIEDNNPVIFIEHRWLYNTSSIVPEEYYKVPIGPAKVITAGADVTIAACSYMTVEALRAAEQLARDGIDAEVIDLRTLKPFDADTLCCSVRKTGRLIVADNAWRTCGFAAEIVSTVAEAELDALKCPPRRLTLPDCPTPTSPALANEYYPRAAHIAQIARQMCGGRAEILDVLSADLAPGGKVPLDVPDKTFTGPF